MKLVVLALLATYQSYPGFGFAHLRPVPRRPIQEPFVLLNKSLRYVQFRNPRLDLTIKTHDDLLVGHVVPSGHKEEEGCEEEHG